MLCCFDTIPQGYLVSEDTVHQHDAYMCMWQLPKLSMVCVCCCGLVTITTLWEQWKMQTGWKDSMCVCLSGRVGLGVWNGWKICVCDWMAGAWIWIDGWKPFCAWFHPLSSHFLWPLPFLLAGSTSNRHLLYGIFFLWFPFLFSTIFFLCVALLVVCFLVVLASLSSQSCL